MPVTKETIQQFAQRIKNKYPDYKDVDDTDLVNRIISKHPEYKDRVDTSAPTKQNAPATPPTPSIDFSNLASVIPGMQTGKDFLNNQAAEASWRINTELLSSDKALQSLVSKQKGEELKQRMDRFRRESAAGVTSPTQKPLPFDLSFTTGERDRQAAILKPSVTTDPVLARKVLEEQGNIFPQKKNQIKADLYRLDAKDRVHNAAQISENAKKIEQGDLDYNVHTGQVQNKQGFWRSLGSSYNERIKGRDDYNEISQMPSDQIIKKLETERNEFNPDAPVDVPHGVSGFFGHTIGSQNPLGLVVGAMTAAVPGAEELAPWTAAYVSSPEIHALSYVNSLRKRYNELRDKGAAPNVALEEAEKGASFDANLDLAQGALMTAAGVKAGLSPTKATFSKGFLNALTTGTENVLKSTAKEAIPQGFLAAGIQGLKNIHDNKPIGEGVTEAGAQTAAMIAGLGLILKTPEALKAAPKVFNKIKNGVAKNSDLAYRELGNMVAEGHITPEEADKVTKVIENQKSIDSQIPAHIQDEDTRGKIQELVEHRQKLELDLQTLNKAYHPAIKEKISTIDEQIQKLSDLPTKEKTVNEAPRPKATEGLKKLTEMPEEISPLKTDTDENEAKAETQTQVLESKMGAEAEAAPFSNQQTTTAKELLQKGLDEGKIDKDYAPFLDHSDHLLNYISDEIKSGKEAEMKGEFGDDMVSLAKAEPSYPGIRNVRPKEGILESRHADTPHDEKGIVSGPNDKELSTHGRKDANDLANEVEGKGVTKIVTSDLERAKETGNIVSKKTGAPVENNPELRTWDIGDFDGIKDDDFKRVQEYFVNHPDAIEFEGKKLGESFNQYKDRVIKSRTDLENEPPSTLLINHSNNMMLWDAYVKNGKQWNEQAAQDYLHAEKPEPATLINKTDQNAIRQQSPDEMGVREQEALGRTVGEGNAESQIPAGEGTKEGESSGQEEGLDPYGLPFIDEPSDKRTGIKNSISRAMRFERVLPKVDVAKLGSDGEILQQGKELVESGKVDPWEVVDNMLNNKPISTDDVKAMQYYMHQLDAQETNLREAISHTTDPVEHAHLNEQLQQLSDDIDRATEANIKRGKQWSDEGNIRQVVADKAFNPSRDRAIIKEAYGGVIPEAAQERLNKALQERDAALKEVSRLKEKQRTDAAQETLNKNKGAKKSKKTEKEFKDERAEIKKSISDKLKNARSGEGGLTAVPLPFVKELTAIAPDVFKLVKSYAEEGIIKLEEVVDRLHSELKSDIEGLTKKNIIDLLAGKYNEKKPTKGELQQKVDDIRHEAKLIAKLNDLRKGVEETKRTREQSERIKELQDKIKELRKKNDLFDFEKHPSLKSITEPKTDLESEIQRLKSRAKNLEDKLKSKDFLKEPVVKQKFSPSNELVKAQQRVANAEYKIRVEKRLAFESKKNFYQKSLMWLGRGVRLSVLSGTNVLAKLASAATIGGALKRIPEQTIGAIYSGIFHNISKKAVVEGMPSLQAEFKFYKEFFNPKKFAENTWEIVKTGESKLNQRFGGGEHEHIPGLYLMTDLHQVIKDPLKRATFEASRENAIAWAAKSGLDINDPLVSQSIDQIAYKRANYEIFQEQNKLTKAFGKWKSDMEAKGNIGATGKFLADFMIPVSTVPTNIVRRLVTTSPFGLIRGGAKVVEAYRKGIESLSHEEADAVMKQLKQGTLGTALWLIGWFGYSHFGGLYSKYDPNKKRMQGDLVSDEMEVNGEKIPKPVQHALPLEIIQLAATARRIHDNYAIRKGEPEFNSILNAGLGSIGALLEQIPVIETGVHAVMAGKEPYEGEKLKEDVKRRFEPQILRETGVIKKEEKKAKKSSSMRRY